MEITHKNMLPGLQNKAVEFFAVGKDEVEAFYNRRLWLYNELPHYLLNLVREAMKMEDATLEEQKAWVRGRYGGLSLDPDITECGKLGKPDFFDDSGFDLGNGRHLTSCELKVLKLVQFPDKLIAHKLQVGVTTVLTHWKNIRDKTGLPTKIDLAVIASKLGII